MTKVLQLRPDVRRVATLAGITGDDRLDPYCDYVCDTIQMVCEQDRRATSSKPDSALVEAAKASLALNKAVCELNASDREWVNKIADTHPFLREMTRVRGTTPPFEIDELSQSAWLLALLFNSAVNRSSPPMAGLSAGGGKKAQTWGVGGNMMLEFFLRRLLIAAREAGGEFSYNKNKNTGTLAQALDILRPHLPPGVIPNAPPTWVIQDIKTEIASS